MPERRSGPGWLTVLAAGLLLGSLAFAVVWLNQPPPPATVKTDPRDLDVFCSGRVDAAGQVISLEPTQAGRVLQIFPGVSEGATVQKGQPLLALDDTMAVARYQQALAGRDAARIEVDQSLRAKQRFPLLLSARQSLLNASAARVEAAEKALQQRKEQQAVTPLGKYEAEAMEAQIQELKELRAAEIAQFDDLKRSEGELNLRAEAAQVRLRAAEAELVFSQKLKDECILLAPLEGTILRCQVSIGGIVAPGSPVPPIVFAPAGPFVIRAEVDQESLGRVREGLRVVATDENRPDGPQWKGRLKQVGGWVALRRTMVLEPGEISDVRTVECLIELDPSQDRLWIGQRMRVRILQEPSERPASLTAAR